MTKKESAEMSAIIAAQGLIGKDIDHAHEYVAIFSWVNIGESFRCAGSEEVMTKTGYTWYRDRAGNKYKTGPRTAVVKFKNNK